ncbi:MAG: ABC transporter ATP-binding protein [Clostridia bacterium]|nr:ABC transporter ATP-binding protein [Clostridia bacterium]
MIEVKNVVKKYGDFTAVENINFNIKEGEIVGLLGPNGAGKSTTMNMLTGFIEPTEGEIIINGYDITKKSQKAKKQIGYMPEGVPLYNDLTVKEFVSYMADLKMISKRDKKENIRKVIEQTNLSDVQNKLIRNLSRGYKQRVSMAGALVGAPKILILDEPTVGLDPKQITEIRTLIKSLGKSHTIILSSHILSEVSQICEKVIIINKGKIIAIASPKELEEKVKNENSVQVTIEEKEKDIEKITTSIKGVKQIKFVKDNEDGTKEYLIISEENTDIRKEIFEKYAKEDITIYELKKQEATLEDAFMKLIEGNKEGEEKNVGNI